MTEEAPATFPHRLLSVLGDEEAQQSIRWLPDGRAFDIHNPNKFTTDVLKTHFNSISLETFVTLLKRECTSCVKIAVMADLYLICVLPLRVRVHKEKE